jgi:hypothetical protein
MSGSRRNRNNNWLDFIETVLVIVGFILLIGLAISYLLPKKKEEPTALTKEQRQQLLLEQIQARIRELEPQKEQLLRTEKRYFFWARFTIGCLLLLVNGLYLYFDNWIHFDLGKQLNINGAIVLIYSFAAFILYGNPNRLVIAIKKNASQFFLRKHMHILSELQFLKEQEKEIVVYLTQNEGK